MNLVETAFQAMLDEDDGKLRETFFTLGPNSPGVRLARQFFALGVDRSLRAIGVVVESLPEEGYDEKFGELLNGIFDECEQIRTNYGKGLDS